MLFFDQGSFVGPSSTTLSWSQRFPLIVCEIITHLPDIVALAECNHFDGFDALEEKGRLHPVLFEHGYQGVFVAKRAGPSVSRGPDGVAVFWRTAVVVQMGYLFVWECSSGGRSTATTCVCVLHTSRK